MYKTIDMGTNSIRVLTCEVKEGKIVNRNKDLRVTRLGSGVDSDRRLQEKSMTESIEALKDFIGINEDFQLLRIIATSAVRDSINKGLFIDRIKDELDLEIDVISGDEEAYLGYIGVMADMDFSDDDKALIIDIGGGSTELILGCKKGIDFKISLDAGAVRYTGRYIQNDPPTEKEIQALRIAMENELDKVIEKITDSKITKVIGIGGTITTLGAIELKMDKYDPDRIQGTLISKGSIEAITADLKKVGLIERKAVIGLQPKRADIIISGIEILLTIMNRIDSDEIIVSDFDNLEGIVYQEVVNVHK